MDNRNDELELSQLADGELDADRAAQVLLPALEDPARRNQLRDLLKLRLVTAPWRRQEGGAASLAVAAPAERPRRFRRLGRVGQLAAAAAVGGLLVLGGLWLGRGQAPPPPPGQAQGPDIPPEERQHITEVFRFYESVAGPLKWYVADERQVQLASLEVPPAGQDALAVVLTIARAGDKGRARTMVVVCRDGQQAAINLPAEGDGLPALKLRLIPRRHNGAVEAEYALGVSGPGEGPILATLAGRRRLGAGSAVLGQLPWQERMLSVAASAWVMGEEK
jgi:hypothetical protein